jgi:uncharacterized membrane protein
MATSGLVSLLLFFVGLGLFIVVLVVSIILAVSYLAGWGALSRQYRLARHRLPSKNPTAGELCSLSTLVGFQSRL